MSETQTSPRPAAKSLPEANMARELHASPPPVSVSQATSFLDPQGPAQPPDPTETGEAEGRDARAREDAVSRVRRAGREPTPLVVGLGFALLCAIWGEFPVAAKIGITKQPPILVAGVRFTLAGLLMGAILFARGSRPWLERKDVPIVVFISMTIVGIPATVFFWGAQYAQVSVLTLVWSVQPIFLSLLNIGNESEGMSRLTAVGMASGMAGVTLVILGGNGMRMSALALTAELAVAASAFLYSLGFQQVRDRAASGDLFLLTAWQLFLAGLLNIGLSLIFEHRMPTGPSSDTIIAFAFLVICCSCIAYGLTNWLVRYMGVVRTGYNALLTPAITVLLAAPQLGEPITAQKLIGLVLVVAGLLLIMPRAPASRARKAASR